MLFIESYDAKSLDRSSVSMIDKYNSRLNIVGTLLIRLSALIDNLLSLIRDVRNTLGQCKQRVYDNLNQVKEVIDGNDITGTEGTISAIETALAAGDAAIAQAEATLEGVQQEMECNETPVTEGDCGEYCNEEVPTADGDCSFCNYASLSPFEGIDDSTCSVCSQDGCVVNINCNEETFIPSEVIDNISIDDCTYATITDPTCNEDVWRDASCDEMTCNHSGDASYADNCTFTCTHSSGCYETGMPTNCTYSCIDGGCDYEGDDCSYGSTCGQSESCNQFDCGEFDCGEPCGETCHMTDDEDCSEDCSEGSCGECSESDDGPCNQYDCSEYDCGEPCGESCGLL